MVLITEVVQILMFYDTIVDTIVSFNSGEHIYFGYSNLVQILTASTKIL